MLAAVVSYCSQSENFSSTTSDMADAQTCEMGVPLASLLKCNYYFNHN